MKKILVIGLCPSKISPDFSAFHPATKSRKTLDKWFKSAGVDNNKFEYINVFFFSNEEVYTRDQKWCQDFEDAMDDLKKYDKIMACGKQVTEEIQKYFNRKGYNRPIKKMLFLPHPSGRNRLLNDPKNVEIMIKDIKRYVNE